MVDEERTFISMLAKTIGVQSSPREVLNRSSPVVQTSFSSNWQPKSIGSAVLRRREQRYGTGR